MSMILLDADFNGSSRTIRLKYYDEDRPLIKEVYDYHPYLLEKGAEIEKFNPITLKNEKYNRITFETPDEMIEYDEREGGYEQMWYHRSYLSDKQLIPGAVYENGKLLDVKIPKEYLAKFDKPTDLFLEYSRLLFQPIPDFRMLSIDIKVEVEVAERPDLDNPINPIRLITAVDNSSKYCWTFDCNIDDAVRFDTETEMIERFMEFMADYPIILTFGGDWYDLRYLKRRGEMLGLEMGNIIEDKKGSKLVHGSHLDLNSFFKLKNIQSYAFPNSYQNVDLNELSEVFLGEVYENPDFTKKLTTDELFDLSMRHSDLTFRLTQFDDHVIMRLIILMMRITKVTLYDITRSGISRWIYVWMIYEHRRHNYLIPDPEEILAKGDIQSESKTGKYGGVTPLEPKPGVFPRVVILDFRSLFPSIIKEKNLSYETLNCPHEECKSNTVPGLTHWVCGKHKGLLSTLLGMIKDIRVNWFKGKDPVVSLSLKVLINATYGVIGSDRFVFYCPPMAESTTAYAIDLINGIREYAEELKINIIYGATDSLFLAQPTEDKIEKLLAWAKDQGFDLEIDYRLHYIILTDRKNNYFGVKDDGEILVVGLMGRKSNTPRIFREAFNEITTILSKAITKPEMHAAVPLIKKRLDGLRKRIEDRDFMIEDVMTSSNLTKRPEYYKTWVQNLQVVAQLVNAGQSLDDFRGGVRLDYVKVEKPVKVVVPEGLALPKGQIKKSKVIPADLVKVEDVDTGALMETFVSVFSQLLEPLKIEV